MEKTWLKLKQSNYFDVVLVSFGQERFNFLFLLRGILFILVILTPNNSSLFFFYLIISLILLLIFYCYIYFFPLGLTRNSSLTVRIGYKDGKTGPIDDYTIFINQKKLTTVNPVPDSEKEQYSVFFLDHFIMESVNLKNYKLNTIEIINSKIDNDSPIKETFSLFQDYLKPSMKYFKIIPQELLIILF